MGATRWQSLAGIILPASRQGILTAVILGLGRAIGETMAVQMVIGNITTRIPRNLTTGATTMPAAIVTQLPEAADPTHRSALIMVGFLLLIIAFVLIAVVRSVSSQRQGVTHPVAVARSVPEPTARPALIGPSGCGKSTMLRSFNRMNDLVDTARVEGRVRFHGKNYYDSDVVPAEVRRRIGMVFQKPNRFPKSIYENIAWGARVAAHRGDMHDLVEETLRAAALWDEVKDKLNQSALALSGGQQPRLCIARTLATRPDMILVDEPRAAGGGHRHAGFRDERCGVGR